MKFMIEVDKECDLYKHFNADCLFEIMFLGTLTEFKGRSIGRVLCEYSIQLANEIRLGENVEILPEKYRLMRPKIVSAIFTSPISQKIGKACNFQSMATVYYTDFTYNGIPFSERLGKDNTTAVLAARPLE